MSNLLVDAAESELLEVGEKAPDFMHEHYSHILDEARERNRYFQ